MSKNLSMPAAQKKSHPDGRLEQSLKIWWRLRVETVSNRALRLLPMPWTAPMITIEMSAAIRPYSIAVASQSSSGTRQILLI